MQRTLVTSILLFAGLALCCHHGDDADGRVTITFWHSFVATTIPSLNELISRFEAEHPTIRIKAQYVPTGDALVQKLVTSIQSKTAPDVAWIHADFLDKLVEANAIYPMEEFIGRNDGLSKDEMEDFFQPLLQSAHWRGTLYALPMEATSLALFYNKDLFGKAGLDPNRPPATWDELGDYARKLTIDNDGDGVYDQHGFLIPIFPASGELNIWMTLQWLPYLWQAGGREINDEQTHVMFDSDAGVRALTLWKNIYSDLRLNVFSMSHDVAFSSQLMAMVMDGPWDLPRYRAVTQFEWAVAPLPAGPAGRATYIAGEHLAIFRQSKHADAAWTFVRWVVQPDVQAFFSSKSGYLPVRQSTLRLKEYEEFLETDAALKAFVEQMRDGRARHPIDYRRVEINRFLAEALERATLGGRDPKSALTEAAEQSNRLLNEVERERILQK
jgi:multiple sugar transport system substrate-binding protein